MISCANARRLLSCVLVFIIALSISTPLAFAQQRRAKTPSSFPSQRSITRKLPQGTKRVRPPRTYDVLHYTIRTRFDVPNKIVIGDETVTLKPLAANFKLFELDASSITIEAVTLSNSSTQL